MRVPSIAILIAAAAVSVSAQAPAATWPQFRGSSALLGTTGASLPATLKLLWTYDAGDSIESSAAIVDGVVYVGSQTGELHAVNLADGKLKWKYKASADGAGPMSQPIPEMEQLVEWLPAHIPAAARDESKVSVVHGDYRLDNLMFDAGAPRVIAVLDWELSTLGHPLADFAYHCMTWRMPPGPSRGMAGLDLPALGIPTEEAYLAAYCRRTGRTDISQSDWEYYMVFNMFRLTGILQGIMARALQGNASSAEAMAAGKRARPLAELAWQLVERIQQRN